jgi:cell division transport system ATP-binding protein
MMIELKDVTMEYQKGVMALNGVNLSIDQGEFVFIVGDSGSGKSTLIKLLLKEIEPTSGEIIVNGQNLGKLRRNKIAKYRRGLGVIFQDFRLLNDRNIYDNIAFAQRVVETPLRTIKKKVPAALSLVGLAQKYKAFPTELSGGEQQRVAIARAIINEPMIVLADEPTGNLDPTNSWEIMKLLEEANEKNGTTIVVVTHNQDIVNEMKKRVVTMKKGVIVSDEKKGGYINED